MIPNRKGTTFSLGCDLLPALPASNQEAVFEATDSRNFVTLHGWKENGGSHYAEVAPLRTDQRLSGL